MRSKELEEYKKTLKLSQTQRSILVGTILGDGHLETENNGRTYRLKIEHSIKQSFYVDWLYRQFQEWAATEPKVELKLLRGIKVENYGFYTLSVGNFRFYAKSFYNSKGKKGVPVQIKNWLTPLALAVWFMDDGSAKTKYNRAITLNTHGYSKRDIAILIQALQVNFGLEAKFRKQADGLQLIMVGPSAELFYKLVQPYVLPNFTYKFGALVNNMPKKYRRRSKVS